MAILTWDDVMSDPGFQATVRPLYRAAERQFLAIPGAQPEIRAAAMRHVEQRQRTRDAAAQSQLESRALDLRDREIGLVERGMEFTRRRRPYATVAGIAGVGVQGLSSLADYRRLQRSEATNQQQQQLLRDIGEQQRLGLEAERRRAVELSTLYRPVADKFYQEQAP